MVRTQDGFELAELDLELRGPGEFFGTRQAGLPDFRVANLLRDCALLELAKVESSRFAQKANEEATAEEKARVWARLKEAWQRRYGLARLVAMRTIGVQSADFRPLQGSPIRRSGNAQTACKHPPCRLTARRGTGQRPGVEILTLAHRFGDPWQGTIGCQHGNHRGGTQSLLNLEPHPARRMVSTDWKAVETIPQNALRDATAAPDQRDGDLLPAGAGHFLGDAQARVRRGLPLLPRRPSRDAPALARWDWPSVVLGADLRAGSCCRPSYNRTYGRVLAWCPEENSRCWVYCESRVRLRGLRVGYSR